MHFKSFTPYHTPLNYYDQYYANQVGSGMPVYRGSPVLQRGYGLGGLLGGLFRRAMPFLKKGAALVGKQALRTGMNIADDVMSGQNIKTAAKRRLKSGGQQLGADVLKRVQTGRGKIKRNSKQRKRVYKKKSRMKKKVSSKAVKGRRRLYKDIFG